MVFLSAWSFAWFHLPQADHHHSPLSKWYCVMFAHQIVWKLHIHPSFIPKSIHSNKGIQWLFQAQWVLTFFFLHLLGTVKWCHLVISAGHWIVLYHVLMWWYVFSLCRPRGTYLHCFNMSNGGCWKFCSQVLVHIVKFSLKTLVSSVLNDLINTKQEKVSAYAGTDVVKTAPFQGVQVQEVH